MFAISSMRPSLFRAEVSLLGPLQLFRLCWVLVYSEERKCYRPPRIFIFRDLRRGSTGTFPTYVFRVFAYFPAVLPRKLARGAALRGHPGQVRMLQKMPKYGNLHFWSWGIRSILQNVLWLGSDPGGYEVFSRMYYGLEVVLGFPWEGGRQLLTQVHP